MTVTVKTWERQVVRAGPLVKELRMVRPRNAPGDSPENRRAKEWIKERCSLNSSAEDALELRLALFGFEGVHYVLTFSSEKEPKRYSNVVRALSTFAMRVRRSRVRAGLPPGFDYIRCIEGLHGDRRWHVHLVVRESDFPGNALAALWPFGVVFKREALLLDDNQGFRRLARYFLKERRDGDRKPLDKQPLSWSHSLRLPEAKCSAVKSGSIRVPADAICARRDSRSNQFGAYNWACWISPYRNRVRVRGRVHTWNESPSFSQTPQKDGDCLDAN